MPLTPPSSHPLNTPESRPQRRHNRASDLGVLNVPRPLLAPTLRDASPTKTSLAANLSQREAGTTRKATKQSLEHAIHRSTYRPNSTSEGKPPAQRARATTANQQSSSHSDVQHLSSHTNRRSQTKAPMGWRHRKSNLADRQPSRAPYDDMDRLWRSG